MSDEKTYELTGGPEGTGTIQRPGNMKELQKLKYDEAIRRRQKPGIYEKLDQLKQQAQAEYEKKIGKSRPTYFPSQQENEGKVAFRQFFEDADKQPPVSGDYEPTEQDLEDEFEEFTDPGSKTLAQLTNKEKMISKLADEGGYSREESEALLGRLASITTPQFIERRREMLKDIYDYSNLEDDSYKRFKIPEEYDLNLDQYHVKGVVDKNTEIYGKHIPGAEDMSADALREASFDAAAKQYGQKYENQQPVSESTVEFDGVEYVEEVYDDGAVFFVPTGEDGDYMRGENKRDAK